MRIDPVITSRASQVAKDFLVLIQKPNAAAVESEEVEFDAAVANVLGLCHKSQASGERVSGAYKKTKRAERNA
jgi:hypothetical protein